MQTHLYFINNELEKQFIHYHDFIQNKFKKLSILSLSKKWNLLQKSIITNLLYQNHLDIKLLFILLMEMIERKNIKSIY